MSGLLRRDEDVGKAEKRTGFSYYLIVILIIF